MTAENSHTLTWDDFTKVDMRVGKVTKAEPFPAARKPAMKLWIDFGPTLGTRKTSAQITQRYTPESMVGRKVVAVVNFPPKQIADFMSEVLVLGAEDENGHIALLAPEKDTPLGKKIY